MVAQVQNRIAIFSHKLLELDQMKCNDEEF